MKNRGKNNFFNIPKLLIKKGTPIVQGAKKGSTRTQEHHGVTWVDTQDPTRDDLVKITEMYELHSLQIDQSLEKGQIAQLDVEDDYIFLLLHFPYLVEGENRIVTSQVSVFLSKTYLITVHEAVNPSIRKLFNMFDKDTASELKSPGRILYYIIEHQLKDVATLIQAVSRELDEIEENVFDDRYSDAFQIGQLRQKIMRLRRTMATQKSVLDELDAVIDKFADEHLERYYEINTNTSRKLWETVEEARETIEIYKDADFTTSTEKTNQILSVLTLLFTLTIPATVIGTFYGMNILLPGGIEAGSWTFLGDFTALKIVVSVSIISASAMYIYFKRKGWF